MKQGIRSPMLGAYRTITQSAVRGASCARSHRCPALIAERAAADSGSPGTAA
ncbi:MAG: hypothetical protein JWR16_1404 [Nevskia sp.]|nr:hypothetical protein [Nevskia sp.]